MNLPMSPVGFNEYFGADENLRPFQRLQHAPEVALGYAVAVHRRGVEVVDAELHGARDRALLVGRCTFHHQATHGAAAEAQHRNFKPCFSQNTRFHNIVSAHPQSHHGGTENTEDTEKNEKRI